VQPAAPGETYSVCPAGQMPVFLKDNAATVLASANSGAKLEIGHEYSAEKLQDERNSVVGQILANRRSPSLS